jgi:protocatechuate 3,4-dioxygenase alpha subunit
VDQRERGDPAPRPDGHQEAEARPDRTPSQTVGPFFSFALPWPEGPFVVPDGTPDAVWLRGQVLDGAGDPVPDALVETWQADADGRITVDSSGAGFRGFGRCPTDEDGRYAILTVVPGAIADGGRQVDAPHLAMAVFGRGLLKPVWTRVYFEGQPGNDADPVLAAIDDPDRRATLIAERTGDGYRFDIRLQGARETVFFDF